MNKSMLIGTVLGVTAAVAGGVWASYEMLDNEPETVEPIRVAAQEPQPATPPRDECVEVTVERERDPRDPERIAGTVIGAVVGGAIGSEVGDGSGKKVATVAGAAGGAYAGNRIQDRMQENNTQTTTEIRC